MTRWWNPSEILQEVARSLGPLRESVMFVGGAVTWLHITDPGSPQPRQTMDVDVVVEVTSIRDYNEVGDQLRALGFEVDSREGAPTCRWCKGDVVLDLLPTDGKILGFSNQFYRAALPRARDHHVEGVGRIRVAIATDFLAMKIEAFRDRGNEDYESSKDMEDVVAVIDGRPEIVRELGSAEPVIREYVAGEVRSFLADRGFRDALHGHFRGDAVTQTRVGVVRERFAEIAALRRADD